MNCGFRLEKGQLGFRKTDALLRKRSIKVASYKKHAPAFACKSCSSFCREARLRVGPASQPEQGALCTSPSHIFKDKIASLLVPFTIKTELERDVNALISPVLLRSELHRSIPFG
jgi:hypothetical protein